MMMEGVEENHQQRRALTRLLDKKHGMVWCGVIGVAVLRMIRVMLHNWAQWVLVG